MKLLRWALFTLVYSKDQCTVSIFRCSVSGSHHRCGPFDLVSCCVFPDPHLPPTHQGRYVCGGACAGYLRRTLQCFLNYNFRLSLTRDIHRVCQTQSESEPRHSKFDLRRTDIETYYFIIILWGNWPFFNYIYYIQLFIFGDCMFKYNQALCIRNKEVNFN